MAAFLELRRNADQILMELEHLARYSSVFILDQHCLLDGVCFFSEAEYAREYENQAALRIQSTWRGHRVRSRQKLVVDSMRIFRLLLLVKISPSKCDYYSNLLANS